MTTATLLSTQIGEIAPLGPDGIPSGFHKSAVKGAIEVTRFGLAGVSRPTWRGWPETCARERGWRCGVSLINQDGY